MCKSILLLKDLSPSSEDTIDSCTQLSHSTDLVLHKRNGILSSLTQKSQASFPLQMCRQHLVTMSSFSEPKLERGRAAGEQGPRALPRAEWKPPTAAVSGAAARARGTAQRTPVENSQS